MAENACVKGKNIVVLGGGYAGVAAVNMLVTRLGKDASAHLTLVTKADFFYHSIGAFRTLVEEKFGEKICVPYTKLFEGVPNGKVLQGKAVEILPAHLVLEEGQTVPYDYLIIATGSGYPSPCKTEKVKREDALAHFDQGFAAVKEAKHILVVGGGPVGIELAGEVLTDYPDKKVTLVHSGESLMPGNYSDKFRARLKKNLEALKCEVILGEKVLGLATILPNPTVHGWAAGQVELKTNLDRVLNADFVALATGNSSLNSKPATHLGADVVDEKGQIKVRPTLQLEKFDNVFAIGDVANFKNGKLGYLAAQHGDIAAENIFKLTQDPASKLKTYNDSPHNVGIVTTGRNGGVVSLMGVWGNNVAKKLKSKDLFVPKQWATLKILPK